MAGLTTVLTVSYDGARFNGFAKQPGLPTVQAALESALAVALRRRVGTVGAGRTDAGVHALGQVVSFPRREDDPDATALRRSVNALITRGIVVRDVRTAHEGFSARFDACSREYVYRIFLNPAPPLFLADTAWWRKRPLDIQAMRAAAAHLVGERDFAAFCVADSARDRITVRTLTMLDIDFEEHLGERCLVVRVRGSAFLHSMVRVIVGTLVEVGSGARTIGSVAEALTVRERAAAGVTAPAHGLTLWSVEYLPEVWVPEP